MKVYPYIGKKTYYPFPTFRVLTINLQLVSETSTHYPPIYKSSCVSLRDNFTRKY